MKNIFRFILIAGILFIAFWFFNTLSEDKGLENNLAKDYEKIIRSTNQEHERLQELYQSGFQTEARTQAKKFIQLKLSQEVFPAWYGTDWDFNGTTETPQEGEIACGYFISTTLLHTGFQVERFKLAQQSASIIIRTLCEKSSIQRFSDFDKFLTKTNQMPDGLYLVGLDTHVGFLEKINGEIDFIHSSRSSGVIRERADYSSTLLSSEIFVIGNLLANPILIEAWLNEDNISVEK